MQKSKVPTSIGEGIKSTWADLGRRECLSLNKPTSVEEGIKSYTTGQGSLDLTEDPHVTSNESG